MSVKFSLLLNAGCDKDRNLALSEALRDFNDERALFGIKDVDYVEVKNDTGNAVYDWVEDCQCSLSNFPNRHIIFSLKCSEVKECEIPFSCLLTTRLSEVYIEHMTINNGACAAYNMSIGTLEYCIDNGDVDITFCNVNRIIIRQNKPQFIKNSILKSHKKRVSEWEIYGNVALWVKDVRAYPLVINFPDQQYKYEKLYQITRKLIKYEHSLDIKLNLAYTLCISINIDHKKIYSVGNKSNITYNEFIHEVLKIYDRESGFNVNRHLIK